MSRLVDVECPNGCGWHVGVLPGSKVTHECPNAPIRRRTVVLVVPRREQVTA